MKITTIVLNTAARLIVGLC